MDRSGFPVEGAKAQACVRRAPNGTLQCLQPSDADAEGVFDIDVPEVARCMISMAMRVVLPNSGLATTYCELPTDTATPGVAVYEEPKMLFPTYPAVDVPPGPLSETRTVVFEDGLELELDPSRYYPAGGSFRDLSSRRVTPDERGLCFMEAAPELHEMFAFYPEGDVTGEGLPISFPNTQSLAAGSKVALYALGGLDCFVEPPGGEQYLVHEGEWDQFGTGTVNEDGTRIVSDPGSGLPCFTWFGYGPITDE